MTASDIIFCIFAFITVGSGAVVVFSKRIVYSAFALLFTFFGVAGLYILLSADFLAATQVIIYVGGILVLLLFGVMMTHRVYDVQIRQQRINFLPGMLVVIFVFAMLLTVIFNKDSWVPLVEKGITSTTSQIGNLLMTDFLLPFEVASVLLLIALMGAALIARREKGEGGKR